MQRILASGSVYRRRACYPNSLNALPEQERALIVRRYFRFHTQTQIARDMGTSQVQVSRMEKRVLNRMRELAMAGYAQNRPDSM